MATRKTTTPPTSPATSALTKPANLSDDASWAWDKITAQDSAGKLLKPLDALGLEIFCENFARYRQAVAMRRKEGLLAENSQGTFAAPWILIEKDAAAAVKAWATEYGLTPLARGAFDNQSSEGGAVVTPLEERRLAREKRRAAAG